MDQRATMVPFVGGSFAYHARFVSDQRTVNFYPETMPDGQNARVPQLLAPTPGESIVGSWKCGEPCRALHWAATGPNGQPCLWGVFGSSVYRWTTIGGNVTPAKCTGSIVSGTGRVSIADNGYVLAIADGSTLWVVDLTAADGALALVSAPLPSMAGATVRPSVVAYIASRFVINDANPGAQRNVFLFSNLNSQMPGQTGEIEFVIHGTTQANYYTAQYSADAIDAIVVNDGRLYVLGSSSYEIWAPGANADTGDDPFDWVSGATAEIGTQAAGSVAQIGDFVFWLGGSASGRNGVYMSTGLKQPVRVSTNALERKIANMAASSAAIGFCYTDEGHTFYCLTFDADGLTVVYDVSTQLWHERSSRNWTTGEDGAWIPRYPVNGFGQRLFWGTDDGRLAELDHSHGRMIDAATGLADKPAVRRRIGPVLWSATNRVAVRDLAVDMEIGTTPELAPETPGDLTPNSQNPRAMLRVSRDGGYTWGNRNWRSFGRQGAYEKTVRWKNLGWGRSFVVELSFSEDFPFVVAGLRLGVEVLGA